MKFTRMVLFRAARAFKVFLTALSSLVIALGFGHGHAASAPHAANSPLLAQTRNAQASVVKLVAAIKTASGGAVSAANIQPALSETLAAYPGATLDMTAGAINFLKLQGRALLQAANAAAASFGIHKAEIASAIITDTYMNYGRVAAMHRIAQLRLALGPEVVEKATTTAIYGDASELAGIEPASGGLYDG